MAKIFTRFYRIFHLILNFTVQQTSERDLSYLLSTSPKKSAFQARGCRLIVNWKKIGKDRDRSSAGWGLQASVAPGTGTRCCSRNNSCRRGFGRQCRGSISTYRACRRGGVSWRTVVVMAAYRPRDARRKDWSTKHWLGYSYLKSAKNVLKKNVNAIYSIIFYVLKSSSYYFWNQLSLNYLQPVYSLLMKYNISKQISPHSFFFNTCLKLFVEDLLLIFHLFIKNWVSQYLISKILKICFLFINTDTNFVYPLFALV